MGFSVPILFWLGGYTWTFCFTYITRFHETLPELSLPTYTIGGYNGTMVSAASCQTKGWSKWFQ